MEMHILHHSSPVKEVSNEDWFTLAYERELQSDAKMEGCHKKEIQGEEGMKCLKCCSKVCCS
jgi:hypothetical protein